MHFERRQAEPFPHPSLFDDDLPKGLHYYLKSEYLPGLSSELLDAFRGSALKVPAPLQSAA